MRENPIPTDLSIQIDDLDKRRICLKNVAISFQRTLDILAYSDASRDAENSTFKFKVFPKSF